MKIFKKIISLVLTAAVMMSMVFAATVSVGADSIYSAFYAKSLVDGKERVYISGISNSEMQYILDKSSDSAIYAVMSFKSGNNSLGFGYTLALYNNMNIITDPNEIIDSAGFVRFSDTECAFCFELKPSVNKKYVDFIKSCTKCNITLGILNNGEFTNYNGRGELFEVDFFNMNEEYSKDISKLTISKISNKSYTGKAVKPAVTIKDGDYKLKKGTDYTVSYKNNTKIGTATVTIKGKGNYTGTKTLTFKIVPAKTTLKVSKKSDTKATFSWAAVKGAEKYQLYYSVDGGKTYKKYTTISGSKTSYTTSKLNFKKYDYKFKIRAYDKVDKTTYYGSYSKIVSVK